MSQFESGVFWMIGGAVGLVASAMLAHIVHRALSRSRELLQIELDLAVEAAFRDGAVDEDLLSRLRRVPSDVARRSLVHALMALGPDHRDAVADAYGRLGFVEQPLHELRSWNWTRRAEGALELGAFRRVEAAPRCLAMLASRMPEARLAAARALSDMAAPGAVRPVLEAIATCTRWAIGDTVGLIHGWGPAAVPELHATLRESPVRQARMAAVEALGELAHRESRAIADPLLDEPDAELRTCVARAIGRMGGDGAIDLLKRSLDDSSWEVRAVAARALGAYGDAAAPLLQEALNDPSWWVRMNAGEALTGLQAAGVASLRETLGSNDLFARDMAKQMLDRVRVRGTTA